MNRDDIIRYCTEQSIFRRLLWIRLATFVISILQRLWKRLKISRIFNKIDGISGHPFFGSMDQVISLNRKKSLISPSVYILELYCGRAHLFYEQGMYRSWCCFSPVLTVFKPDIFQTILLNETTQNKSWEYFLLEPWLGLGLLTGRKSGLETRKMYMAPSFHSLFLEEVVQVFNQQSTVLVKKLKILANEDWVDISPLITHCTLDIIVESVMGVQIEAQKNSDSDYVKAVQELGEYFSYRSRRPWLWPNFLFNKSPTGKRFKKNLEIFHNFTRKIIGERKLAAQTKDQNAPLSSKRKKRKDILDMLLDGHMKEQLLSEEDIRMEVDAFMFQGHATMATAITWVLYNIGIYPEIQKKIVKEIDQIFGHDRRRLVTENDLNNMKYLECTLKESQRLFPSVPIIGRTLCEDLTINGLKIPKGTSIHLFISMLHRNKEEFPNPEVFDPDRFLPNKFPNRHPCAYVPFSAGPRDCTGQKFAMMEAKTVVCNILRKFQVISLDPRDKVHMKLDFVLKPAQPLRLKLIPKY